MKIYHNPRCAKSRQTLALLHDHNVAPEIVLYLVDVPDALEMKDLLLKLGMTPLELIRKNEASWKENYKGKGGTGFGVRLLTDFLEKNA